MWWEMEQSIIFVLFSSFLETHTHAECLFQEGMPLAPLIPQEWTGACCPSPNIPWQCPAPSLQTPSSPLCPQLCWLSQGLQAPTSSCPRPERCQQNPGKMCNLAVIYKAPGSAWNGFWRDFAKDVQFGIDVSTKHRKCMKWVLERFCQGSPFSLETLQRYPPPPQCHIPICSLWGVDMMTCSWAASTTFWGPEPAKSWSQEAGVFWSKINRNAPPRTMCASNFNEFVNTFFTTSDLFLGRSFVFMSGGSPARHINGSSFQTARATSSKQGNVIPE